MAEPVFETTWKKILSRLKPGMPIRNWTALKGYPGDVMTVAAVGQEKIVVQAPGAKHLQHVSVGDFEAVWEVWADYKAGRVQRQAIAKTTRYSKYAISILHWLDCD